MYTIFQSIAITFNPKSFKDFNSIRIILKGKLQVYSSRKVTHNILVYRQVQIIVAVTCFMYIRYFIEYEIRILMDFGRIHAFEEKKKS